LLLRPPPLSTLFPYTTLFRSLRKTWRSGLLSSGYQVVLPWKAWPSSEKLRVTARFTLVDGRSFEADKDVSIRLTPAVGRKGVTADRKSTRLNSSHVAISYAVF